MDKLVPISIQRNLRIELEMEKLHIIKVERMVLLICTIYLFIFDVFLWDSTNHRKTCVWNHQWPYLHKIRNNL